MIGYICKYAPIEIIEAFGEETVLMEPRVQNFTQADILMHSNMCSFIKAVLEDFENISSETAAFTAAENSTSSSSGGKYAQNASPESAAFPAGYDGMIFTSCCDSSRRLYDTLSRRHPDKFFYCMDLPRKINDFAASLYAKQIRELIEKYSQFSGKTFSEKRLYEICKSKSENASAQDACGHDTLKVALCGARCSQDIKEMIKDHGADIILDMTCNSVLRNFSVKEEDLIGSYSRCLLNQIPCMRMAPAGDRGRIIESYEDRLDGIIYHTIKFCDIYSYEYTHMHQNPRDLPILNIETDATDQCSGQILTRLEAFLESVSVRKKNHVASGPPQDRKENIPHMPENNKKEIYVCGIDSGSTSTNAVIMDKDKNITAFLVLRTGAKSAESARRIYDEILQKSGLLQDDISLVVSTGYGRVSIPFADKNVTEISCHGRGAHFVNPKVRTILDIGGQDSKAIKLDENGDVIDFVMNDKCAAGTGRFLEMMARTLEIDISRLGPISLEYKENIEISSMCSVFAESEVISLIAQNKETADIARAIHRAIGKKAFSLMKRVGLEGDFMMTGGVAKNPGVVDVMEELLKAPLYIYEQPEIVGAIGAALYGLEELS